ncbi:MAG: selenocysteine-specific translation elongation factor [Deltaproteobacteria bacterium]|nr:selenocysteine-specific translation elongation factor [Deltaproteobacteria bacterium]
MSHIIGTAGHIDHGKTALIRALTGQDTDRLKEEKDRGISIDIGFAYMDLATGERIGIVDVPGHERFIKNMLAGAHGIDLVLLVVAADDGVMPQTEEHLDIVHLLGATHGIVVITKVDLVDATRLAAVREEIEILLSGTNLEGSPLVAVSPVTGEGIATLRQTIEQCLGGYKRPAGAGYFRLPIDRAFVMHGHGTVVTGTAITGGVKPGDSLRILPGGEEVRVRSVQVHGRDAEQATSGQRVALNLAAIERRDVGRGHVVCDRRLDRVADRLDAWVEIRSGAKRRLKSHEGVRVYLGTAEALGKLVWLDDQGALSPKQAGYAQLVLRQPLHALRGDRFILRDQTAQRTLGGGIIVHPFAPRHKRGEPGLSDQLDRLRAANEPARLLATILEVESDFAVATEQLAQIAALPPEIVYDALRLSASIRGLPDAVHPVAYTTAAKWTGLRSAIIDAVSAFHRTTPLAAGLEMESLRSKIAAALAPNLFRAVVDALVAEKAIARDDSLIRLPSHRVRLASDEEQLASRVAAQLEAAGVTPPTVKELETQLAVPAPRLRTVLQQLERRGMVAKIEEGLYFAHEPLERARELLRQHVLAHGDINAATFRDLLGASRKFSIALLDYFDRTGFTLRVGDIRKLRR